MRFVRIAGYAAGGWASKGRFDYVGGARLKFRERNATSE